MKSSITCVVANTRVTSISVQTQDGDTTDLIAPSGIHPGRAGERRLAKLHPERHLAAGQLQLQHQWQRNGGWNANRQCGRQH